MKKFAFTLQNLLNVKISLEKQAKAELADCQGRLRLLLQELEDIHLRVAMRKNEWNEDMRRGGINSQDMATYFIGFRALQERIDLQKKKIDDCEKEKARLQKKVIDVMGERKMLENLKEKQREEYKALQKQEDAKIIDDFLSNQLGSQTEGGAQDG